MEFQGSSDIALFWPTDWDEDGNLFGLEFALDTDPLVTDTDAAGNPAPYPRAAFYQLLIEP